MDYVIYTDGGSRGNPGVAGAGVVIKDSAGVTIKEVAEPLGIETNNYAEYSAVAIALDALRKVVKKEDRKETKVEIVMDSELVCKQLSNEWELREESLWPLYMRIHNSMVTHFPEVTFRHVRREENKEADALANKAMDEAEKTQGALSF